MSSSASACPCGSGSDYAACCGRWLEAGQSAETAEQLMRSRYTAYVLGRENYLLASWHATTRPADVTLASDPPVRWLGLKVIAVHAGSADDNEGIVEFVARYKQGGRAVRLHERSRFVREDGRWFYLDGDMED